MPSATQQSVIVAVTAARPITKEQREDIRREVQSQLPADAVVIVLEPGQSLNVFPMPSHEAALLEQILVETKRLRADMSAQHGAVMVGDLPLRIAGKRQ